jgi:hypothetical protein
MSKRVKFLNVVENHAELSKLGQPWATKLFDFIDMMRGFGGRPQDSVLRTVGETVEDRKFILAKLEMAIGRLLKGPGWRRYFFMLETCSEGGWTIANEMWSRDFLAGAS